MSYGQPLCLISGGEDNICISGSTSWSAPENMILYSWTGPAGFSSTNREITISTEGEYLLTVMDATGTSSCSRRLSVFSELKPGSINTTLKQFCTGGTAAIGGTTSPYGPATGGSGSYTYTWQFQQECTGDWIDIPETNVTSYTPVGPAVTTCYRRKVTDDICGTETFTGSKMFMIFSDPVSQDIDVIPSTLTVCAGTAVYATFSGGSGGFPGGVTDIYEYSISSGTSWEQYMPGQSISTSGLSGTGIIRFRTRRISTGVNGCNYGAYVTRTVSVNPIPVTSPIFHR